MPGWPEMAQAWTAHLPQELETSGSAQVKAKDGTKHNGGPASARHLLFSG
ncbi:MAG: hypothetical protein ABSB01_15885 [Streptosporangiaceae bacterium]